MITKLNLSTHPFRNRTLPYIIALVLLAVAVGGAVLSFAGWRNAILLDETAKSDLEQMRTELAALKNKGELVQQQLTPEQQSLLIAAHKLVANKSFGWSQLFSDLEKVMPGGVSASRISVENIYQDDDKIRAELDFAVLSRDYQSVVAMIENMNNLPNFRAELRGQDRQKTESIVYTEYSLHLIYTAPNVYAPAAPPTDVVQNNQGGK